MASMVMPNLSVSYPRRRPVTYGKTCQRFVAGKDASCVDNDGAASSNLSAYQVNKPARPLQQMRKVSSASNNEDLFDVPSSDDETSTSKCRSYNKHPSKADTEKGLSTEPSMALERTAHVNNLASSDDNLSLLRPLKKRKRSPVLQHIPELLAPQDDDKSEQFPQQITGAKRFEPLLKEESILRGELASTGGSIPSHLTVHDSSPRCRMKKQTKAHKSVKHSISSPLTLQKMAGDSHEGIQFKRTVSEGPIPLPTSRHGSRASYDTTPSTPTKQTGAAGLSSSPRITTTPRQAKLWNSLFAPITDSRGLVFREQPKELLPAQQISRNKAHRRRLVDKLMPPAAGNMSTHDNEDLIIPSPELPVTTNDMEIQPCTQPTTLLHPEPGKQERNAENLCSTSQQRLVAVHGQIRTYSCERSYLEDNSSTLDDLLIQPLQIENPIEMVRLPGKDPSFSQPDSTSALFDVPDDEDGLSQRIRSVHELRASGDNERFISQMELLLEELEDSRQPNLDRKRNSLLVLCNQLSNPVFRNRFAQHGFHREVFSRCQNEIDIICGTAIVAAIIFVLDKSVDAQVVGSILSSGVSKTMLRMLEHENDIAAIVMDHQTAYSEVEQKAMLVLRNLAKECCTGRDRKSKIVSVRNMALHGIQLVCLRLKEFGSAEKLLNGKLLQHLLEIMQQSIQVVEAHSGHDTYSHLTTLETILTILEFCTAAAECAFDELLWSKRRLRLLVDNLDVALSIRNAGSKSLETLALRLCLNLANNNARNAHFFAKSSLIQRLLSWINTGFHDLGDTGRASMDSISYDTLLLALGTMINLVEWSEHVRQTVLLQGYEQLDRMLQVLLQSREELLKADSTSSSQANVVYGYLAVLLGNLCQHTQIRARFIKAMPNALDAIGSAVDEFVKHHQEADKSEGADDVWLGFTARIQSVSEALRDLQM